MLTEQEILLELDNFKISPYCHFVDLGDAYSYLIDSRLNIFRGENDQWAIAAERLGYPWRAGYIELQISYFGNCLLNLEEYNGGVANYYSVTPIPFEEQRNTTDSLSLNANAKYWNIRDKQIPLSHNKQDYLNAGIELNEFEPGKISLEEIGRLLITQHQELLRATDNELYKSIPKNLKKILVINEWYHRDFFMTSLPEPSDHDLDRALESAFQSMKRMPEYADMDITSFKEASKGHAREMKERNAKLLRESRPSAYETWQLIAKVIAMNDASVYNPTIAPNSHWRNWPESGSL